MIQGWVRAYDTEAHHHFYVDTTKDPHRSIWVHPFDDDQYLSTLSAEEREQVEHESMYRGQHPSSADIIAAHSDEDEDHHDGRSPSSSSFPESLPPRSDGKGKGKTMDSNHRSFGSKMKDKLTGTTHEQREEQRRRRYEAEQKAMDKHLQLRAAVRQATITGQPVFLGKDTQGKDVYVQPPGRNPPPGFGGYNYPSNGRDPFGSTGMVETPTARFIRPSMPYGRPMGGAYGGGYGFPMMMGGGAFGAMMVGNSINMM